MAIRCGGQTTSYTPRTSVPHSMVAAKRPSLMVTGTPSHREYTAPSVNAAKVVHWSVSTSTAVTTTSSVWPSDDTTSGMSSAGDAIVDMGTPLAPAGSVGKPVASDLPIAGFSILRADSADAVTKLLEDHPHFQTPGDTAIEILEFLPIPGM